MRKMLVMIISLILLFSYGCSSPFSSTENSPDVVYVDVNNKSGKEDGSFNYPFTSIAKGVSYAKEGATIVVRPGTYREMEIRMKRGQKLQGSGKENTIIEMAGHDLIILNSSCELSGFFIKEELTWPPIGSAVSGINVQDIKISNNKILNRRGYPLYLENSSGKIFNNQMNGMGIDYCKDIIIENNQIEGAPLSSRTGEVSYGTGISIIGSSPVIRNNHIFNLSIGIDISMAVGNIVSAPTISHNTIEENKIYGIRIAPFPCEADLGGGKKGSPGGNIIRNNGKWDLLNESPSEIYAQYNKWTHSTEEEIDKYDICDDDERKGGKVIFVPFKKD